MVARVNRARYGSTLVTLLCMRCGGADCACGRLAWLVNFSALALEPMAAADRRPEDCLAEPDDYFVLQPKKG